MACAKTKVVIRNEQDFFGPGTAAFFHRIQELGSMRMATQSMNMSYSKGWKLVRRAEDELGFPMLVRRIGGKDGGSSELTPEGMEFLNRYDMLQQEVQASAGAIFRKYFPEYCGEAEGSLS